jgi:hypothetical protein
MVDYPFNLRGAGAAASPTPAVVRTWQAKRMDEFQYKFQ